MSDYGPGRRRKPIVSMVLDWAAGVLIGIVLLMLGAGVISVFEPAGAERIGAMMRMGLVLWPIGAALGVWLSHGRPLTARGLTYAFVLALASVAALMLPTWLELPGMQSGPLRGVTQIAALLLAPAFARLGVALARARERDD